MRASCRISIALVFVLAMVSRAAVASPIFLQTTLTGDPRPGHPDNLEIVVSILSDTTSNVSLWHVNLEMAADHPQARLDEFGFNLAGAETDYSFSLSNLPYTPTSGSLNGSGNTSFLLTLNDPGGNWLDASNLISLAFLVTKTTNFTLADFVTAPTSCSSNIALSCHQLGAHVQSLGNFGFGSGVAVGDYPGSGPAPVPEPASLVLMGSGALAAAIARRRRTRQGATS